MQVERWAAHLVPVTVLTLAGSVVYTIAKVIVR